jgi:hypothetical protein
MAPVASHGGIDGHDHSRRAPRVSEGVIPGRNNVEVVFAQIRGDDGEIAAFDEQGAVRPTSEGTSGRRGSTVRSPRSNDSAKSSVSSSFSLLYPPIPSESP